MTRVYYPAWIELKEKKILKLAVNPVWQARVLKAIIKEKDMDTVYKYELDEERLTSRISHSCTGSQLVIQLHVSRTHRIGMIDFPSPVPPVSTDNSRSIKNDTP